MSEKFEQISLKPGFMKHNGGVMFRNISDTEYEFKSMINHKAVSFVQPSVIKVGGIYEMFKIINIAEDKNISEGDRVVLNGYGLSESHFGGYSEKARVKSEHLLKLPENISNKQAMAIGTAGYTAMLCVLAIEDHGIKPDDGVILVSGASGGVGSVAISILSDLGYDVEASTGRLEETAYLNNLGAKTVIDRSELSEPSRPLGKERWAGAIDSVGSTTLANILAQLSYGGAVSACGLAQGMDLPSTVMPFILRGISLLGVDSVMAPMQIRERAWNRLGKDINFEKLEEMIIETSLDQIEKLAQDILEGQVRGRVVVNIQ